jgi:hypothetical protein
VLRVLSMTVRIFYLAFEEDSPATQISDEDLPGRFRC